MATLDRAETFVSGAMVPRLLVESLGESKPGQLHRELVATALSADISGFTSFAESLASEGQIGAEKLSDNLNRIFSPLIDCIASHGGEVMQFAGDNLLALWLDDDSTRALKAALTIQQLLGELDVTMRMGISRGPAVATCLGGWDERWHFVVAGPSVHQAQRLEHVAAPGTVNVDDAAWRACTPEPFGEPVANGVYRLDPTTANRLGGAADTVNQHTHAEIDLALEPEIAASFLPSIAVHARPQSEFCRATVMFMHWPDAPEPSGQGSDTPHEWSALVQKYLGAWEGTELQILYDADGLTLVAAWGLMGSRRADDTLRAIEAALQINAELAGRCPGLGIGLATGVVFAGLRGNQRRCEFAVMGDVVNLAARLAVRRDGLICDEATFDATWQQIDYARLEPIALKGISTPTSTYRALGRHRARSIPLIARDAEVQRVSVFLDSAPATSAGAVMLIEGEAGIGKSSLLDAAAELAVDRGLRVLRASGSVVDRSTPFAPWRNLLRALYPQTRSASAMLQAMSADGFDDPDLNTIAWADPTASGFAFHEANDTAEFLARLLAEKLPEGGLLVLDDMQWFDSASIRLLAQLLDRGAPLRLIAASRPPTRSSAEEYKGWRRRADTQILTLEPLDREQVADLVCSTLGAATVPAPLVDWLVQRGEAQPLFIRSLLLALQDSGAFAIHEGECRLQVASLDQLELPDSIDGVIVARLDHLSGDAQQLLKTASAFGLSFELSALEVVIDDLGETLDVRGALEEAIAAELVKPSTAGQLSFDHSLTRDTVYATLPYAERSRLHRQIGVWLEAHSPAAVTLLAHHWHLAGDGPRTCRYSDHAGEDAMRLGAYGEAARFFGQALATASEHGNARSDVEIEKNEIARWEGQLGMAMFSLGDLQNATDHLLTSLDLHGVNAPRSRGQWRMAIFSNAARQLWHRIVAPTGEETHLEHASLAAERLSERFLFDRYPDGFLAAGLMAANFGERAGRSRGLARSYGMLGAVTAIAGLKRTSRWYFRRAYEVADAAGEKAEHVFAGYSECVAMIGMGQWDAAAAAAEAVYEEALELGDRQEIEMCSAALGNLSFYVGEFEKSLAFYADVIESGAKRANLLHQAWGLYGSARALHPLGRLPEAAHALGEAMTILERVPEAVSRLTCHGLQAVLMLEAGEVGKAREAAAIVGSIARAGAPTLFSELQGFAGAADVLTALWERERTVGIDAALREDAVRAVNDLKQFAGVFTIGEPLAALHSGRLACVDGKQRRALKIWERGLKRAEALKMPYDALLLHRELAQRGLVVGGVDHAARAEELAQRLGCPNQ